MGSPTTNRDDRLTSWVVSCSVALAAALVVAAIVWSWRLQIVAGGLQLLGILMTALGVVVVWSLLELLVYKASDAKRALQRGWAARRERLRLRLRLWWAHVRGKSVDANVIALAGTASGFSGGGATLSVGHPSVDRATISDRDWLVFLSDQLDVLREELRTAQTRYRSELGEALAAQQDRLRREMRDELQKATRQGWELVLVGLAWLAIGTIVGMWA